MAFTYTNSPATVRRDAIRLLIFDVVAAEKKLDDEQIDYFLAASTNDYAVAANACLAIAARAAEDVSSSIATIREEAQQRFEHYRTLGASYFYTANGMAPDGSRNLPLKPLAILPGNTVTVPPFFTRSVPE